MVAVAASPSPGAVGSSRFVLRSHDHPPYKVMIVNAIAALNDRKGSSRPAILKYIADNYAGIPSSHSILLSRYLRRLQSKGVIRMLKHSYKLADPPASGHIDSNVGSKKRGRPLKNDHPAPVVLYNAPKGRGRPRKLRADSTSLKKMKSPRLPNPNKVNKTAVDPSSVYILPQAEQLKSGFLRSLPGAVAIILPHGLLSKKTARNPVLILPNGVQALVDSSDGRKKVGRPRKDLAQDKPDEPKQSEKTQPIPQRRKVVVPKQVLLQNGDINGDRVNIVPRKYGRPRKMNNVVLSKKMPVKLVNEGRMAISEAEPRMIENADRPTTPEIVQGKHKEPDSKLEKRSVGRPRKNALV